VAITRREFDEHARGPLNDVRVVDLSRLICGNTLTLMLANFGAEVIKIEPATGDTLRYWKAAGIETYWKDLARNKKSVCIDFRHPKAIRIIKKLAEHAAIFVESFRPGTLEAMGLAPEVLHAINPKLVIVRISGWGQTGPYRRRPGFGTIVEGMSGFAALNGFPDREPCLPPLPLADAVAGITGAGATMIALRNVEVGEGRGQVVDLSLFDPLFSLLGPQAANFRLTGKPKARTGSRGQNAGPRNVYQTKDGKWLALSASIQAMVHRLFEAIGRPDLVNDPRFRDNAGRVANADALDAIIGGFIRTLTLSEALAFFEEKEITVGPVYDIVQILEDPHFQYRESIVELPDAEMGQIPVSGIVARLSATPGIFARPAPTIGQHNREILSGLSLSPEEISALEAERVIQTPSLSVETAAE
jgi:formyl-CoA transferase